MAFEAYRAVLGSGEARAVLALGMLLRIPLFATFIVLTLHVVDTLGRSYADAGLLTMASTVAVGVSGPWRGRLLDQRGLRATIAPQLVVLALVWMVAPFVGFWALMGLVVLGGLFTVPTFSVTRQVLIATVADRHRTAALSLDSLGTEVSFMIGPVLGVLFATYGDTRWALLGFQLAAVAAAVVLWVLDPPLLEDDQAGEEGPPVRVRDWLSPLVVAVLGASVATTVVLSGSDLAVVAALRSMGEQPATGWVLAVWGGGSALGALVYGALHRPVPVFVLLALLSGTTIPVVLATGPFLLAALLFVCGFFCAPTVTATVDALSRLVPPRVRGEVMGWHGSALTLGSAVGSPLAGYAIDQRGWQAAFVVTALFGLVVAAAGLLARAATRDRALRSVEA